MSYDFRNLSSANFEDLVRDLIEKEEGFASKHSLWGLIMILMADTHMLEGMSVYR
ncbi:hypothetical protein HmCmsJML100_00296 [Escherichia coli]|nr:hypothetical+protein [Escherichia coli]STE32533.1 Uncharacterised protein [Escherichia coli]VZQ97209.1 Uncharacterised protein [Escherichia coli]BAX15468.1 hypothetical protein MRY15117_c10580 [Escherichia coli]BAX20403.1 hypothetical protein MRY15131_c10610 [Escherichia coli]